MNRGGIRISRRIVTALVAAAALLVPAQAGAATAAVVGDTLAIGGGAESSDLTITRSGPSLVVADAALNVSEANDCDQVGGSPRRVVCPAAGVKRVVAVLVDGNDRLDWSTLAIPVTFYGGNGADTALGGAGTDSFNGGAGNDVFSARDGVAESVACGDGADSGTADPADTLTSDCEAAVERPAGDEADPADDGPVADDTADDADDPALVDEPAVADAPVVIDTPSTVVLSARGEVAIGVSCTATDGDCTGRIEIVERGGAIEARAASAGSRATAARRAVVLGRARFTVAAGQTEDVTVRLSRAGRQRVIKKKRRRTRARIVITTRAPDGTATTAVKDITIAAPRERRTSGRGKPKPPKGAKGGNTR